MRAAFWRAAHGRFSFFFFIIDFWTHTALRLPCCGCRTALGGGRWSPGETGLTLIGELTPSLQPSGRTRSEAHPQCYAWKHTSRRFRSDMVTFTESSFQLARNLRVLTLLLKI